jgi:hypothetical protein
MTRRAPRCQHGTLAGMCVMAECPHFDGRHTWREKERAGRGRRFIVIDDPEAPRGHRRKLVGP